MAEIYIPEEFYCPITGSLINNPVSEPAGHTYEKTEIEKWLSKSKTSPMTREHLDESMLKENIALKRSIESIRKVITENQLKIYSRILKEQKK